MSGLRTIYLGTSDFAAKVLERLVDSPHKPTLVITPPDRKQGRGRKLSPPPAAIRAVELGIELHQTESVNRPESIEAIHAVEPEIGCVCAFGQLIKAPLLDQPPMYNVHPSLLPRWRGAAPIERALIEGDRVTGVSIMRLTEGLDSGPVAYQAETEIGEREDFGALAARLAQLGGELLVRALDEHVEGLIGFEEQTEEGLVYAEKIEAADRLLDPAQPATALAHRVAGLTPHVGAYLQLDSGDRIGVTRVDPNGGDGSSVDAEGDPVASELGQAPGDLVAAEDGLLVRCGDATVLRVERLKPPGKQEMDAADFLRGHRLEARAVGADG